MNLGYIDKVTTKYGQFALSDYLKSTGHQYATFLIDISQNDIKHVDGLSDDSLKKSSKEGLNLDSKGIYALYGQRRCKSSDNPVEVLMIEKDLWESTDEDLKELLIFHEVCHLLEKSNYYKTLNIKLSENELKVGDKLSEIANKLDEMIGSGWGNDEDHNQIFGALLFHFLSEFDSRNSYELLAKAMIKNFGEDYSKEFKEVD